MPYDTIITTDHAEIRSWIEERGGHPSVARDADPHATLLHVLFPGLTDESTFDEISWEDFFQIFEEHRLAFLYQQESTHDAVSRFHQFIRRDLTLAPSSP